MGGGDNKAIYLMLAIFLVLLILSALFDGILRRVCSALVLIDIVFFIIFLCLVFKGK